ncbi:MAG: BMC domain-containing protein [Oscillospiraceae bacterium]|nr:BMC domain-containing protein [Oscillospiraceae bacterium]
MRTEAVGVIEVNYYSNAVVVLDAMLKASDVDLVSCHKRLGGRMVHAVVKGSVSNVDASVETAKETENIIGKGNLKVAINISNPHPEVVKLMNMLDKKLS